MSEQKGSAATTGRRAQLRAVADAYFDSLAKKEFEAIPYDENVILRSPLAPPDLAIPYESYPLEGRDAVIAWFQGLAPALGETKVIDYYYNEDLTGICVDAEVGIVDPPGTLRVADRFIVNAEGKIIDQENHYDPRPAFPPSS
ncbi:MAG TPA: nuclear transport factor 2 family protein [Pyrinomonadaceae bacterium]